MLTLCIREKERERFYFTLSHNLLHLLSLLLCLPHHTLILKVSLYSYKRIFIVEFFSIFIFIRLLRVIFLHCSENLPSRKTCDCGRALLSAAVFHIVVLVLQWTFLLCFFFHSSFAHIFQLKWKYFRILSFIASAKPMIQTCMRLILYSVFKHQQQHIL